MSGRTGSALDSYRVLLRQPGVGWLLAGSVVSRLPFSINALAVLLFLREATGSFAVAGVAAGALSAGIAIGGPIVARLADRRGARTLFYFALAHCGGLVLLWVLGEARLPTYLLFMASFVCGLTLPPCTAVLLERWPALIKDPELLRTAYACEAVSLETAWVAGPLITAAMVALGGAGYALLLSAGFVVIGTAIFLANLPDRAPGHQPHLGAGGFFGAIRGRAVRIVAIASLPIGFCGGTIEVAVPAFSADFAVPEYAGVLLAIWAVASGVGGLLYGALASTGDATHRFLIAFTLFPITSMVLALAVSIPMMALLLIVAGLPLAPLVTTRNEVLHANLSGKLSAESFSWTMTTLIVGSGIGSAVAGLVVHAAGWREALVLGSAVSLLGLVYSFSQRKSLRDFSVEV